MENRREMNTVCYSKEDLEIMATETVLQFRTHTWAWPEVAFNRFFLVLQRG